VAIATYISSHSSGGSENIGVDSGQLYEGGFITKITRRSDRGIPEISCGVCGRGGFAPIGMWPSLVKASVWGTEDPQFKSGHPDSLRSDAVAACKAHNLEVRGSNPLSATKA
jgi:hypothetical protein